jgi:sn-glycerol 3-phosphate transport system substrate-binding protein
MKADHYDETQIQASARSSYSVNGVLWPGYMNISTPVLYYNKVHFQKAGLDPATPPGTLEEVYQDALKIKKAGVAPKPFVLSIKRWFFETWLDGIGDPIVNNGNGHDKPATKAVFDTPAARKMMDLFVKMKKDGVVNLYPDTAGSIDHYLALISKPPQSSMLMETSSASTTIRSVLQGTVTAAEISSAKIDTSGLDTGGIIPGTAPFPGIDAPGKIHPSGGAFYILNTDSPAQQAASWEFMKFMLQPKQGAEWHLNGAYLPAVKSVADRADIQKFWNTDLAGALLKPSYDQFVAADPDQPGPLIGPYQDFTAIIEKAMDNILLNDAPVDSTLQSAQDQATKLLQDYNGN